jgi:hypothetical protein
VGIVRVVQSIPFVDVAATVPAADGKATNVPFPNPNLIQFADDGIVPATQEIPSAETLVTADPLAVTTNTPLP